MSNTVLIPTPTPEEFPHGTSARAVLSCCFGIGSHSQAPENQPFLYQQARRAVGWNLEWLIRYIDHFGRYDKLAPSYEVRLFFSVAAEVLSKEQPVEKDLTELRDICRCYSAAWHGISHDECPKIYVLNQICEMVEPFLNNETGRWHDLPEKADERVRSVLKICLEDNLVNNLADKLARYEQAIKASGPSSEDIAKCVLDSGLKGELETLPWHDSFPLDRHLSNWVREEQERVGHGLVEQCLAYCQLTLFSQCQADVGQRLMVALWPDWQPQYWLKGFSHQTTSPIPGR